MNNKQRLYLNTVKNFWTYFYYKSSLGEKATRGYQTQQPKHWRLWEESKHMGDRRCLTPLQVVGHQGIQVGDILDQGPGWCN